MSASGNTKYLILLTTVAALGGLLFGFDIAIITGAAPFIQEYFDLDEITRYGIGKDYELIEYDG